MMKTHRGISAVIGTVFLIAVVIAALSYISYSMDVMGNFSEQLIVEETRQKNIQDEKFELLNVNVVEGKLDVTIKNTGEIPIKITTMYLDEMGANDVVQKIDIDQTISPGNTFDFFSESIDVDVESAKGYTMKFISSRGESQTFYLNSASQEPLDIRLIALPDRMPIGFDTTLIMVVVNNMSNNNPLVNLVPIEPACSGICSKLSGPTPASHDKLDPGDVAIFEWTYALDGENEQSVTFRGELQNGYANNYDDETVTITTVQVSELAGQSLESLGFGHSLLAENLLILHTETYGVPESGGGSTIPSPLHNYELNGDASDESGGNDLQLSDSGSGLTSTGWNFLAADDAQIVAGEIPDSVYAIEMVFSFDDTDAWIRLMDFHDHKGSYNDDDAENGLYVETDNFNLYAGYDTGGTLSDGTLTHVLIQRNSTGDVEMYQNGLLVMSYDDSASEEFVFLGEPGPPAGNENIAQPAIFFKDNGSEDSAGFVDCIRVFDETLSSTDASTVTSNSSTCYPFAQLGINQMSPNVPDTSGTTLILDDVTDTNQWFSANATAGDITIFAGVWNASLRYNHDRLPPGMAPGASSIHDSTASGGGHTLHFNTDATLARKDSGQMSDCTDLVDSGTLNGATWGANYGVNGSGAYFFDGNDDYITITNSATKKECNYVDDGLMSVAGWFNSTNTSTDERQHIISKTDPDGVWKVSLGDNSAGGHGKVIFKFQDEGGDFVECETDGVVDYTDNNWHHFAGVMTDVGDCELYVDGVSRDTDSDGGIGHEHGDTEPIVIGAMLSSGTTYTKEFYGVIDDIMYWNYYSLTADDVTALYEYSFGANATRLNFYINNATGVGDTEDVIVADLDYGLPWVDKMTHTDVDDLWAGANWTSASLPAVILPEAAPYSRLNFTIGYASGDALNLRIDDDAIDGTTSTLITSYLQTPGVDPELPVYRTYDNDSKVTFFTFNGEEAGVWFTYQGTRIVFNGTNGHYTGVVDTVDNGVDEITLDEHHDSPFIERNSAANLGLWHP